MAKVCRLGCVLAGDFHGTHRQSSSCAAVFPRRGAFAWQTPDGEQYLNDGGVLAKAKRQALRRSRSHQLHSNSSGNACKFLRRAALKIALSNGIVASCRGCKAIRVSFLVSKLSLPALHKALGGQPAPRKDSPSCRLTTLAKGPPPLTETFKAELY